MADHVAHRGLSEEETRLQARSELHDKLVKYFRDAEDSTQTPRERSEKDRDYYDNIQYTSEEVTTLEKRGQSAEPFNRIAPKIDFLLGAERQQRTQPKLLPRNQADEGAADAATEALRFVLVDNDYDNVRSTVFEHLLIEGSGFGEVTAFTDNKGQVQVGLKEIPWDRGFIDPFSRRRDFEDARYRGQVIWMDREEAIRDWPDKEDILDITFTAAKDEDTYADKPDVWIDTNRNRVRVIEIWYREGSLVFRAVFTRGGILEGPDESPYLDEDGLQEDPYVFTSAKINRQGHRYGVVRPLIPIQDEINKRRSKALHLMSVRQVKAQKGAVDDVATAKRELAKPDGWIEQNVGFEMDILPTGDMAASQFNLLQEAKGEIDNVGASAALQGKGKDVESGRAIQARQQGGQMELGPLFDALRSWQKRLYRKSWNRIAQFWNEERWVRITDNPETLKWIGLNQPVTMGQELAEQNGGQLPPGLENDPRLNEVVRLENNLTELDVDIIIAEAPDYATLKQEQFATVADVAKSGVPLNSPEGQALLKLSGVPEVEEILKMLKGSPEEQQQRAQQQQQQQEIQNEDAMSKIRERHAKTGKTVAETERTEEQADSEEVARQKMRAEILKIMAELAGGQPTVAG